MRRHILTPSTSQAALEKRGFHRKDAAAKDLLETIGAAFLGGYGDAVETDTTAALEERLETFPERFRGFAYEGAGMGLAVRDALPVGRSDRVAELLAGPGAPHVYMIYVGVGWAMARLPRFAWPKPAAYDPLLRWLVHDGYGFHQAYFHTRRYVDEQYSPADFGWPAGAAYAPRAIDQGIGRALWFVAGTDAARVVELVQRFGRDRWADLYSGVGLAATYAGGASAAELRLLCDRAGENRRWLAQGSAFAAEARIRAGLLVPHTTAATEVLCGLPPAAAAQITQDVRPDRPVDGAVPAYEAWRQRIAHELASLGGVPR
ncbi:MAG TPA: DUF1702 family protein [Pilimelia sp.]|nr:DUF1702 family protein [Pilimelia sp.]